jgi:hypothetical protein
VKSSPRNATTGSAGGLALTGALIVLAVTDALGLAGALALTTGTDDADTAGGKLGGTIATAVVRLESRSSAITTKTSATAARAEAATINPRLYMADTIRREAKRERAKGTARRRSDSTAERAGS